jgi:pimeloyl-ACP methyl ester carboxylesterase
MSATRWPLSRSGRPSRRREASASRIALRTKSWVAADGVRIVGDVAGNPDSPAVVLLHGGGQTRHSWSAAVEPLRDAGYFVVNVDLRGHGDSGWSPDGQYSAARLAGDLRTVMVDIAGPAAWVGASMGGMTAMQALAEGMNPKALVLVDIVLRPEIEGVDRIRKFMLGNPSGFASIDEAAGAVAAYNPRRQRPANPEGLLKNLRLGADERYYWHWDPRVLAEEPDALLRVFMQIAEGLRASVQVPTLLVRGAASDVVSDAGVAAFREVMPHVEVFDVAHAGHMVAGDSNDAFNGAMLEFLARQFAAGGRR